MAEPREKNVAHELIIWKQLIENELKTAAEWESSWGFLKAETGPGGAPLRKAPGALASAGRSVLNGSGASQSVDYHPDADRAKAVASARKTPKERFTRPVTTSHELGWRPTLEKFGVSHHGVKRDPGLWPEV
mmetsp:Transcript_46448/g.137275  ORF Transcript_46448/g.137275 Transcript_46448/m.137275 type:complete len:132 (+) Transcript_46448:73-468(+)